jgi:hypothetical protein
MDYLFRAIDGTIFEDEDKCKDYENSLEFQKYIKDLVFIDRNKNILPFNDRVWDEAYGFIAKTNEALNFAIDKFNDVGCSYGLFDYTDESYGAFWYDGDNYEEWIEISEHIEMLKNKISEWEEILKVLKNED